MEDKFLATIQYGLRLLARAKSRDPSTRLPASLPEVDWLAYEQMIGEVNTAAHLHSILSLVQLEGRPAPAQNFILPRPLTLKNLVVPPGKAGDVFSEFDMEWKTYTDQPARHPAEKFVVFYNLFRKYAWSLPALCGEAELSLFEQWKTVTAMVFATNGSWEKQPAGEFTLAGGDIPGIQDFVYTITSKGAARGLRGRSLFLQLLGEAVIERILRELGLSAANVIYAAGGNFMLLAPGLETSFEKKTVAAQLEGIRHNIESVLVDEFNGDLTVSLAWTRLPCSTIGSHEFADGPSRALKELIAERKRARFGDVAKKNWGGVFSPQGKPGNQYCDICQVPVAKGEAADTTGDVVLCKACLSFGELARSLGKAKFLSIGLHEPKATQAWQKALFAVSGGWYSFDRSGEIVYCLNDSDFLQQGAHGFRFLATVTPHVVPEDIRRWEEGAGEDGKPPRVGDVRTFSQLADAARGTRGIGILRMDVDNLGQVMARGLKSRTMAATSALSSMLDMFFSGYLNLICEEICHTRPESLYIIYSGGDDLFIVGAWDLMPLLAAKIQAEFSQYTGGNPSLTISGAVTLEGKKFPLYQAANRAGSAEEAAKRYQRKDSSLTKNAIHFLGLETGWEEWEQVTQYYQDIEAALTGGAPKALLQILQNIYAQYDYQKGKTKAELGPWIWRGAYALSRIGGRIPREKEGARQAVERLANTCLAPGRIRYAGLAARWMELISRKEE